MNLLELFVKIGVQDETAAGIRGAVSNAKSAAAGVAKAGALAIGALTAATTATTAAIGKAASDVAAYGDDIDKMSQKMGLSAETYQEWDAVMQHSGTSMEAMKASMKTLANAAETGNKAFEKLGLTQEQVASMNQEQLFEATISGLQNVTDTTERTYLAGQLLGRGATELGALLNTSAEDTQAMRDRVHELGGVMSDEAVKASARFQDSMQDMQTAMAGLKRTAIAELLPGIADAMDGVSEIFAGNTEKGKELIAQGIDSVIEQIEAAAPKIAATVGPILDAMGGAVVENFPKFVEGFVNGITGLANDIADHADEIAANTGTMLQGMLDTLETVLPAIAQAGGKLVLALIEQLITHIPDLILAVGQLINIALETLDAALIDMARAGADLIGSVIVGIREGIDGMFRAGQELINGLINGILNSMGPLGDVLRQVGDYIVQHKGPVEKDRKMLVPAGRAIMEGLVGSIQDGIPLLDSAIAKVNAAMVVQSAADVSVQSQDALASASGVPLLNRTAQPQALTVVLELDRMQLAKAVYSLNNEETQRVGLKLAGGYA